MQTHSAMRTPMSNSRAFYHLSMHSGHVAMQARNSVAQAAIKVLLPIVRRGRGPVPNMPGWQLDVQQMTDAEGRTMAGAAAFQLVDVTGLPALTAIYGYACWNPLTSCPAWKLARAEYDKLKPDLERQGLWREQSSVAPSTPWLAVALSSTAVMPRKPSVQGFFERMKDLHAFGDLERCVAWTFVADEESRA